MENQLTVIDISTGKSRETSVSGDVITYGTLTPFNVVCQDNINGVDFIFHYNGMGYDEENAFYQFVQSDDLVNFEMIGDGFNPENTMHNTSLSFTVTKKYVALELVNKDEVTKGVMKGVLEKV